MQSIVVPAMRPQTWPALIALARANAAIRFSLGIHPHSVPELAPAEELDVDAIARAIEDSGALAVGECGLDSKAEEPSAQEHLFRVQIRAARATKRPLVIHLFNAHDRAPAILREERASDVGGVLHSYSGGAALIPVYRDLGLAFSFAGPVTYANARRPLEAVRAVPAELLLVETDAPDQAPEPHRGGRSEPAYLPAIIAAVAAARGESVEAIAKLTAENARRVLGMGA